MSKKTTLKAITESIERSLFLPSSGSWPESHHRLDKRSAHGLIAAISAGRPLLVRGEPGVGKSQLARAAAVLLQRRFLATVIQPNTEYEELLWLFDHTQRLADAQIAGASKNQSALKNPEHYIAPGPIWYALNWKLATAKDCQSNYRPPQSDDNEPDPIEQGVVLLIDEIDKADISVANGLLEVLGNGRFDVRSTHETVMAAGIAPLVVLTSNDTRELPAALLRRCVVLDLKLPVAAEKLITHLVKIGGTHFPDADDEVLLLAAQQIEADRARCQQLPRTGQAEYLDLLRALDTISKDTSEQLQWLETLADYFKKSGAHSR